MYRHTQTGWGIIIIFSTILLFIIFTIPGADRDPDFFVFGILLLAMIMFARLTVTVDNTHIRLVFGLIGFPRRKFELEKIQSCRPVKNFWFGISLGIHYGSGGSLYNVSGPLAVELTLKSVRKVYIGTDEPEKLARAIEEKLV